MTLLLCVMPSIVLGILLELEFSAAQRRGVGDWGIILRGIGYTILLLTSLAVSVIGAAKIDGAIP